MLTSQNFVNLASELFAHELAAAGEGAQASVIDKGELPSSNTVCTGNTVNDLNYYRTEYYRTPSFFAHHSKCQIFSGCLYPVEIKFPLLLFYSVPMATI